jgi:orotate phosphoribosyltransferase
MDPRTRLIQILHERSFRTGEFTLVSGKKSNYYIDVRTSSTHAEGAELIGELLLDRIEAAGGADAVAGMELGAIPVVIAAVARAHQRGIALDGLLIRKQAKGHGAGKRVEGVIRPGMRVFVVDDVVTTAGSTIKTIDAIIEEVADVKIVGVAAVVDRQEGGAEALAEQGYALDALVKVEELFALGERPVS